MLFCNGPSACENKNSTINMRSGKSPFSELAKDVLRKDSIVDLT